MPRRRFVYRETSPGVVEAFEVGLDYSTAPRSTGDLGKFQYDGLQAPDGTDISSRTKHRDYCKRENVSLISDFKETLPKAKAERLGTGAADRELRDAVGRKLYEYKRRARR